MTTPETKPSMKANAEHHTKAAECCDQAAEQHRNAAKCSTSGDHKKAAEHARNAQEHCSKAHDHGKQAIAA